MTTTTPLRTTHDDLAAEALVLVQEIEHYLATQPGRRRTAHPLVSATTAELVAQALADPTQTPPPATSRKQNGPPAALRWLPDWALATTAIRRRHGATRRITAAEHLELTALVISRYGWTSRRWRTRSGARCIEGAQTVLARLGYGDDRTRQAAAGHLADALRRRGWRGPARDWNDIAARDANDVLHLLREAAATARTHTA